MIQLSGIILSGGQSSRMGSDKAFIEFQGKKLIEYPINLLQQFCNEIIISANSQEYEKLGFKVIRDDFPGCGPIGGIFSSLKHSSNDWNMVVSCDTPFLSSELISKLLEIISDFQCLVPVHFGKIEPLVALYHKSCLPVLTEKINSGNYKIRLLFESLPTLFIDVSDLTDNNPLLFSNFNSPADMI
jgi:molybdenum cofactor guanylyltransferase